MIASRIFLRFAVSLVIGMQTMSAVCYAEEIITLMAEDKEEFPNILGNRADFDWNHPGVLPEMLKAVEKKVGVIFVFRRTSFKRALEVDLMGNTVQGVFPASYKVEREKFGVFPKLADGPDSEKRLYTTTWAFYKSKKSKVAWDGKVLTGLNGNIGVPLGYSMGGDLKGMGYSIEESDYALNDLKKIAAGRIEISAELENQADSLLANDSTLAAAIEKVAPPIVSKPYYLMLSKKFVAEKPELAAKIWAAIEEVRKSDYERLLAKYLSAPAASH